jgi:hypothetical protein
MLGTQCQGYQSSVNWEHSAKVISGVYAGNSVPRLSVECMLEKQCQGYQSILCGEHSAKFISRVYVGNTVPRLSVECVGNTMTRLFLAL